MATTETGGRRTRSFAETEFMFAELGLSLITDKISVPSRIGLGATGTPINCDVAHIQLDRRCRPGGLPSGRRKGGVVGRRGASCVAGKTLVNHHRRAGQTLERA